MEITKSTLELRMNHPHITTFTTVHERESRINRNTSLVRMIRVRCRNDFRGMCCILKVLLLFKFFSTYLLRSSIWSSIGVITLHWVRSDLENVKDFYDSAIVLNYRVSNPFISIVSVVDVICHSMSHRKRCKMRKLDASCLNNCCAEGW